MATTKLHHKTLAKLYAAIMLTLIAAFVWSCSGNMSEKPVISVSIAPEKWLVEQIVGDRMNVRTLLSPGSNPETYEPSMSHLLNLEKSEAYLRLGHLGFEDAVISRVAKNNPDLRIFDISLGIPLISGTHCSHSHKEGDEEHHHEIDPHIWSSVANARIMALNTLNALDSIDPAGKEYYSKRYNALMERLDSIDAVIKTTLAEAPSKRFIIWHPSLSYFARDYDLEQISLGSENKELSPAGLRTKIDEAAAGDNVVMLLQKDFDMRHAQTVNKEIKADIIYINPMNGDWPEEMIHTARAISGKLSE